MLTLDDWQQALADAANELLQRTKIEAPPVNALAVAKSLNLTVALDRTQPGRGRIKRIAGRSTIFLRPEERPERLQWAAAHELGESLTWKVCRLLDLDGEDLSPNQREEIANQLAKEILLPRDWFRRDCEAAAYDLPQLKLRYPTASHELIAWRWLDLETPAFVTVFDQGTLTRRQGNRPSRTPALTAIETRCWTQLQQTRQPAELAQPPFLVRGWCVNSPGWQREILYARFEED